MYRPNPLPIPPVEADEVYVQKLRNSMSEMNLVKENAIRTENYSLADQTRLKMTALQQQLVKMEHQLNADILTNCVTMWQEELAAEVAAAVRNLGVFRKVIN
ncbi:hypothetical protein HK102_012311 [Quaeritorhiza haematococci]|nr:hypothetical protein HK102_012311 [Quaeritorhiza haematococci]